MMLRMLSNNKTSKEVNGWSRDVATEFAADDILSIELLDDKSLAFKFKWGRQEIQIVNLNLREIEEAIKFLVNDG